MTRAARSVASPRVVSIGDLRPLARKRLPRVVFDYIDGGAEGEITLRENCRAFEELSFRPRQAVAVPQCNMATRVLVAAKSLRHEPPAPPARRTFCRRFRGTRWKT